MLDYDVVLRQAGGFGPAQLVFGLVFAYTALLCGFGDIAPVFINYTPDYRCEFPVIDDPSSKINLSQDRILNLTTPRQSDGSYDTCRRYGYQGKCVADNISSCIDTNTTLNCDRGYRYDATIFTQTAITEFNLVCDRAYLGGLATSLYMVGALIGSLSLGSVSDYLGRKPVVMVTTLLVLGTSLGCSYTHTYVWFVVTRFLLAALGAGMFITSFVYLTEICGSKYRSLFGVGFQAMYSVGYMVLSGIAFEWRDWHQFQLVTSLFAAPFPFAAIFVPESPRWLFSVGREEQAKQVSRRFAKMNGKQLVEPDIWLAASDSQVEEEPDVKCSSVLDLVRTPPIRKMTFLSMLGWFITCTLYFGISLDANDLIGDVFINNAVYGGVEIVSFVFLLSLVERIGRRRILIINLLFTFIGLIVSTLCLLNLRTENPLHSVEIVGLLFAYLAKFGAASAYALMYNITCELFPTVVRTSAVGVGSVSGNIGSVVAPLLLTTQSALPWLPNTVMAVLALTGVLVSLLLPETTGVDMMETIEEAERFYQGKRTLLDETDA